VFWLLGAAVLVHVGTADYFAGYAGTRSVAAPVAARWLTWAQTDPATSPSLRALGVKTMLYTDPNRAMRGQQEFSQDESTFAHDCTGARIEANRSGQFLMDPRSPALLALWKRHMQRYTAAGRFDAIFADDANNLAYVRGRPCGSSEAQWLQATNAMQQALGYPVIYNGLSNFSDQTISATIGLNATAIGGMMEQCYGGSPAIPKTSGAQWIVTENTELRMVSERKLFFCYGNDTTQADRALDSRLYVYASFLLSCDPSLSVLWEYYQGESRFHVMPEVQVVALRPPKSVRSVDELRMPSGIYQRTFGACYLAGRKQGECAVAVNPDSQSHPLPLRGYRRIVQLSGGGVLDGGTVRIAAPGPPASLGALSAVIAFK
jgi:hypothetical protein